MIKTKRERLAQNEKEQDKPRKSGTNREQTKQTKKRRQTEKEQAKSRKSGTK